MKLILDKAVKKKRDAAKLIYNNNRPFLKYNDIEKLEIKLKISKSLK